MDLRALRGYTLPVASLAFLAAPEPVVAQSPAEEVPYTTSAPNVVGRLNFDLGTVTPAATTERGANFQGVAVLSDGRTVIVGNKTQGGAPVSCDVSNSAEVGTCAPITSQTFSGGLGPLALDTNENVFGLTNSELYLFRRSFACDGGSLPNCHEGYLDPPVKLADATGEDVAFVAFTPGGNSILQAGDVVVVTASSVLRFKGSDIAGVLDGTLGEGSLSGETWIPTTETDGEELRGLAFVSAREAVVNTKSGRILRFDMLGQRQAPDFALLQGGGDKVSAGRQDGERKVFATFGTEQGGAQRFTVAEDGTGVPEGIILVGLNSPHGIGNGAGSASALTPAGQFSQVVTSADTITFDFTSTEGETQCVPHLFAHPNPGSAFYLSDVLPGSGPELDVKVPAHYQAPADVSGGFTFLLLDCETSSEFDLTIQHHLEEESYGLVSNCDPQVLSQFPLVASAEDAAGEVFEDITAGCASHFGKTWKFSYFLTYTTSRTATEEVSEKLDTLQTQLSSFTCIKKKDRRGLERQVASAIRNLDRGRSCRALQDMVKFDAMLQDESKFSGCQDQELAELLARTQSILFFLQMPGLCPPS